MTSLVYTLTETLRYKGAIGQWSWVLHRLTGLGVLIFLILHVIDTSWAVFYPGMYEHAISIYQSPLFTVGEFALVFAVVYHAFNGIRIVIFDYKPNWWKHQQKAAVWVLIATVVLLIPVFIGMFGHVLAFYGDNPETISVFDAILSQLPFIAGMGAALIAGMLLSVLYGAVKGNSTAQPRSSRTERFWWSFMRISGVLILPLVFGHLGVMHVVQGVFDITAKDFPIVGTSLLNESGTATEFVFQRWNYAISGVYVWRLYDLALLALTSVHGFNGLRYILTDYAGSSPVIRRGLVFTCTIGAVILLVVGGLALLQSADMRVIRMAQEALEAAK